MHHQGWHLDISNVLQTAALLVVLLAAVPLGVHFSSKFFVELSLGFELLNLLHVQIKFLLHLFEYFFFLLVDWFADNQHPLGLIDQELLVVHAFAVVTNELYGEINVEGVIDCDHSLEWKLLFEFTGRLYHGVRTH